MAQKQQMDGYEMINSQREQQNPTEMLSGDLIQATHPRKPCCNWQQSAICAG